MIDNEEVDNCAAETTVETGTEAEEEEECSSGDEKMNKKLEKLKEQLLAELGKKDQSQTSLPTSSPFSKWV